MDNGLLGNFKIVFGDSFWFWFLPVAYTKSFDGMKWFSGLPIRDDNHVDNSTTSTNNCNKNVTTTSREGVFSMV